MASIYFHYPYCSKACSYCNYHFSTNVGTQNKMVETLIRELELRMSEITQPIDSIYFGGGTPSLLKIAELEKILHYTHNLFIVKPNVEITLEANPDDITKLYLKQLKQLGVNRVSLGVQSFDDVELKSIGRIHSGDQAFQSLEILANEFENFSVDLIYGLVHSNIESWKTNLRKALIYKPKHLSLYILTLEKKTRLYHQVKQKKIKLPPDGLVYRQYQLGVKYLDTNGFVHYEISSFALPKWESRHNFGYWNDQPYLGIGPSAHSFDGNKTRSWNIDNNSLYIKMIHQGILPITRENLSMDDRFNEYLLTRLRTIGGVSKREIKQKWGMEYSKYLEKQSQKFISQGLIIETESKMKLSIEGKILADGIISDLFHGDI
ncbi:MAG: radical SAM family heme chaperone HemW [Flavobacteriaceae bacterium]|nr:radical SAM family heme chaperone HemW [Flavobacteriaceae bacterium]